MNWDADSRQCEYHITLKVDVSNADDPEYAKRLEANINAIVDLWIAKPRNKQNLMNTIFGNTGIIV